MFIAQAGITESETSAGNQYYWPVSALNTHVTFTDFFS